MCAAAVLIAASAQAGVIRPLTVDQLSQAPVLLVCRVESIAIKGEPAGAVRHATATLRVLRASGKFAAAHIYLPYYSPGPKYQMRNGHPTYPGIESGKIYLFPLKPRGTGWNLIVDEGFGLVVPAAAAAPEGEPPSSKRQFIFREIVNTLLHGADGDLYRFGDYMRFRHAAEMNDEIMIALTAALPAGDHRWIEIANAIHAAVPTRAVDPVTDGVPQDFYPEAAPLLVARMHQQAALGHRKR